MARAAKKKRERYSYADYLSWGDEKRYEIIDGEIYDMNAPLVEGLIIDCRRIFPKQP